MDEVAEIAKTVRPLVENLAKLTGPLSEELGLYFGDKIRAFRQRNVTATVNGSVKRLEEAGKPVNPVPPRLLLPIIDAASLEDNPTLQEMWIGLLASASDQADNMSPSYVETLKALTPIEARSVKVLYDFLISSPSITLGSHEEVSNTITFGLGLAVGEAIAPDLILETLERLGLIRREYDLQKNPTLWHMNTAPNYFPSAGNLYGNFKSNTPEALPKLIYELTFTSYGIQFMRACQGPVCTMKFPTAP